MTVGKIYCAKLIYENYKHVITSGRKKALVSFFLDNISKMLSQAICDVYHQHEEWSTLPNSWVQFDALKNSTFRLRSHKP